MACAECNDRSFVLAKASVTGRVTRTLYKNVTVARRCTRYIAYFEEMIALPDKAIAEHPIADGPHVCGAAVVRHREIIDRGKKGKPKWKREFL